MAPASKTPLIIICSVSLPTTRRGDSHIRRWRPPNSSSQTTRTCSTAVQNQRSLPLLTSSVFACRNSISKTSHTRLSMCRCARYSIMRPRHLIFNQKMNNISLPKYSHLASMACQTSRALLITLGRSRRCNSPSIPFKSAKPPLSKIARQKSPEIVILSHPTKISQFNLKVYMPSMRLNKITRKIYRMTAGATTSI